MKKIINTIKERYIPFTFSYKPISDEDLDPFLRQPGGHRQVIMNNRGVLFMPKKKMKRSGTVFLTYWFPSTGNGQIQHRF